MRNYLPCSLCLLAVPALAAPLAAGSTDHNPDLARASWIWSSAAPAAIGEWECYTRRTFELPAEPAAAVVLITADNVYELYVNGKLVGEDGGYEPIYWRSVERYDVTKLLHPGTNVIAARAKCLGGFAGLVLAARIETAGAEPIELHTDQTWPARKTFDENWTEPAGTDTEWPRAHVIHKMGQGPWGMLTYPGPVSPMSISMLSWMDVGPGFEWPEAIVFVRGYIPLKEPANFTVSVHGSRAYFEHDAACPPALGTRLCKLEPAGPDGRITILHDARSGIVAAPAVSWDAKTVYFSMVAPGDKFFHIYSISADGTGLKRLTSGPHHDYEPVELPDGRIIFCSTRLGTRDEYHGNFASAIFAMDPDGSKITPVTYHIVADHEPKVTAEGTIAFVRCDNFFERAKVETRIHQIRPDGTGGMAVLGPHRPAIGFDPAFAAERNAAWLRQNGFGSVCPLPDGRIAAICQNGLVASGRFDAGASQVEKVPLGFVPYDISPLPDGRLLCTGPGRSWIGLIDLQTAKAAKIISLEQVHSPVYLGPRPRPPVVPTQLEPVTDDRQSPTGLLLCQSVFNTRQTNAELDRIKAVRIVQGKPFALRSAHHRFDHIGVEGIELGTVPLAPDGSFYVEVPADVALSIQAVDAEGRSVINETSWIYVRPGERLSCVGCHSHRTTAPKRSSMPVAARFEPVKLLGAGTPHRFRANNAGNGGVLNLQFDRFREAAAITTFGVRRRPGGSLDRTGDIAALCGQLSSADPALRSSAAQALAVLRDRSAAPALVEALEDRAAAVRMNAALALSACGDRSAAGPLLDALGDWDPFVAQAANIALQNLTAHSVRFDPFARRREPGKWRRFFAENDWPAIERRLVEALGSPDATERFNAVQALGHVGSGPGRAALRRFVRTHPDGPLRTLIAAIRALGWLGDEEAVPLLAGIFTENMNKDPGRPRDLHELGWLQKPVYLAATAAEALGRIGTPGAVRHLVESTPKLLDFWQYSFRCGDHSWLMGCNSSPIHFRILEALDRCGPADIRPAVTTLLKAIPIDNDRALLYETDGYENLTARVIARSGLAPDIIETCLAVLGDAQAAGPFKEAVAASPPAVSVGPHDAPSRAAQVASIVCLDETYAPAFRRVFDRYRAIPVSRTRSWVCFYVARLLGRLGGAGTFESLVSALEDDPPEASFGYEDPPNVFVYKARTPFYRAAAAEALGRLGDPRAVDVLLGILTDYDNAVSVRAAAAQALVRLAEHAPAGKLRALAQGYPEPATARTLLQAWRRASAGRLAVSQQR